MNEKKIKKLRKGEIKLTDGTTRCSSFLSHDALASCLISSMSIAPFQIYPVIQRIQLLEVETKRSSTKKVSEADANQAADSVETLAQEVLSLKKDVQTAERIAKQSEVPLQLFFSVINLFYSSFL